MCNYDGSVEIFDIVKLRLFLLLFLFMCMAMVLFFIVPNIKSYKTAKLSYESEVTRTQLIEDTYRAKEQYLQDLRVDNRGIIEAFNVKFDEEKFIEFAQRYFQDVELKKLDEQDYQKEFLQYRLDVSVALETPVKFYEFLSDMRRYQSIVKVDFPIEMVAPDRFIKATFNVKVYEYKN